MKLSIYTPIFLLLLLVLNGCGDKSSDEQTFITVDVDKSYSKKEFILQDLFDIEYVRLETNEKFLTSGKVRSIGENLIVRMVEISMSRTEKANTYERSTVKAKAERSMYTSIP
jgi:hypothetical protein